ncbi:hypothetical protein [Bacteroides acidifaciens]|uniref:hypothetical protein n=1 Tax=Bacteroides acidifaciens TaxID=85831 RepID=UPI003014CAB0
MTPEEVIESLVDKFDNANDIIANYLHHKSLDLDDYLIMGSCGVVYLQQTEIEKSIRILANMPEHQILLRAFATEVERLLSKMEPQINTLAKMEVAMIYDIALLSETVGILRHSLNIKDKETHRYLTELGASATHLHEASKTESDIDAIRLAHDAKFDNFFSRIETEIKRLQFIMHFRDTRSWAQDFDMYKFLETLQDLYRYVKRYGIKPFEWSEEDDDIEQNVIHADMKSIFYTGDTAVTDEQAVEKANERGHVYFSLGHIQYIHDNFVCEQFHNIDPHDLYAILNLKDCDRRLSIREGEKNRVYYFISVVGGLIQSDLQLNWRKSICKHLGLSYKAYNSKYKEAADSENQRTVDFRDRLNEFIESFDELAKAS